MNTLKDLLDIPIVFTVSWVQEVGMELTIFTAKHTIKMDSEDWDLRKSRISGKHRSLSIDAYSYVRFCHYYSKGKDAKLHRLIVERIANRRLSRDEQVDHINGDRLDNRRCNLRIVTQRQNQQNQKKHRNGKLVGCSYNKTRKKWQAHIQIKGKQKNLGLFATELEAHEVYINTLIKEGLI